MRRLNNDRFKQARLGGKAAWQGCCLGVLLAVLDAGGAVGAAPREVLLLHSFGREFEPFKSFSESFRTQLAEQLGDPVEFHDVPLESARLESEAPEGPLVDYLTALFAARRLDLVVTIGGPAARFGQRYRPRLFPSTPMLLASVDQRHLQMVSLTTNDAVVAVANDPAKVLENMLQVLPDTTNVAVVIGISPLEKFWLGELGRLFQPFTNRVNFVWFNDLSFADMQRRAAALPPRSVIFYVVLAMDADGVPHENGNALARLHAVANAPIFGIHSSQMGQGIVGGPLMALDELSRSTAKVAVRILRGEPAGSIQTPVLVPGRCVYDWRELRRWHISEARLPAGSMVQFRQPTFWEHYRWRIVGVLVFCGLQTALIIGLIISRAKRRQSQATATLIANLSSRFINVPPEEVDREIEDGQRRICERLGLDVSALWQRSLNDPDLVTMTHLYRPLGGPPIPEPMNGLQYFPWCGRHLLEGRVVSVSSMEALPLEAARDREVWHQLGIKSNLTFPLSAGGGQVFGALGFNTMRAERAWPEEIVEQLRIVAQIFANALARNQADQALRDGEARLSLASEAAGAGMWSLDLGSNRFWLTRQTRELFGLPEEGIVTLDQFLGLVHPEDRELVREAVREAVQSKLLIHIEYRVPQPNGSVRWMVARGRVRSMGAREPDCLMGATVDITERKRATESMRRLQEHNELLLNSAVEGIFGLDLQGNHTFVNPAAARMLGYTREELLGRHAHSTWHHTRPDGSAYPSEECLIYSAFCDGEAHQVSTEVFWRKDGTSFPVEYTSTPIRQEGRLAGAVVMFEDISVRKQAEHDLQAQREELAHVARLSVMGELATSVAHELNQPLGAILSNAEAAEILLEQGPPALGELRAILKDIRKDDERAGEVIRRMRSLLRKHELEREPLELNSLVENVFRLVSADASLRKTTIAAELSPYLPLVQGDRIHLQQVLLNLIVNAMEAMAKQPPEKRRLTVRTSRASRTGDGAVEMSVTDSGPGIGPDNLPRLFEPFFTTKPNGIGMGLSISRKIVEAHHGRIWAENHPKGGAIFRVTLPPAPEGVKP